MSSILDALRKLEQEKTVREREAGPSPGVRELALEPDYDDDDRGPATSRVRTAFFVFGGAVVVAGIGAGLVAASTMVLRRDTPVQQAAANTQIQQPATATGPSNPASGAASAQTTTVKPVQVASLDRQPAPAPAKPAPAPPKQIALKKPDAPAAKPAPQPAPVKPEPAPPAAGTSPAIVPTSDTASPVANPATPATTDPAPATPEQNIDKLPILSEAVRVRLGLPALQINIVGIPNNRNPRASALINMQKVYVGENIPGTSARLIDVNLRGVAVDVNGQRYFLSRR
ncbi:MAG: hypothetical protein FJY92_02880 [Candidatus Hydrogenedentes bacterium]|nr:hypothetical protein [Candidatus Hydrogenedentota bacterium]